LRVPFSLLPAIDLTGGALGVFTSAGPMPLDAYGGDPIAAANVFRAAGARWIHVVDMDLAFTGEARNLDIVRAIAKLDGVRVQASGGVRTQEHVEAFRAAGAGRIVLSSAALDDAGAVEALLGNGRPGEMAVAIEVDAGRIRSRGADPLELDLMATLGWLRAVGAPSLLVTAVARVGTGTGPDIEVIRRVSRSGIETLAAGGIVSLDDLRSVRAAGAVGAVVGRAAIEGALDLAAAFAWAEV
jgi:phosphoribosylformimino-5-aminoimidazole carboxamide ribonucleotide (ProFAR) isomerase